MQEFNYIKKYFKRLVKYEGALNLQDDVCFINPLGYKKLVVNCDTIVEGTHFFSEDSAESVACKAFLSNVSDLYAKGLKPLYYTLAISFNSSSFTENYLAKFVNKLEELQNIYDISLIGGDTTLNNAKLCITINIFALTNNSLPTRLKASVNNNIYLTRTLGDSYLGYLALAGKDKGFSFSAEDRKYFIDKYHFINLDNFSFIKAVSPYMLTSIDVSDGILADLNHVCEQSNVGAVLKQENIPLSDNFLNYISVTQNNLFNYASQGGDYNLLFFANENLNNKIQEIAKLNNTKLTLIGKTQAKQGIHINLQGKNYLANALGYKHSF